MSKLDFASQRGVVLYYSMFCVINEDQLLLLLLLPLLFNSYIKWMVDTSKHTNWPKKRHCCRV